MKIPFIVMPRRSFVGIPIRTQLALFKQKPKDHNHPYFQAHLEAAIIAAGLPQSSEAYVGRVDSISQRYGFGYDADLYSSTILRQILELGTLSSYWCFQTTSWRPLLAEGTPVVSRMEVEKNWQPFSPPKYLPRA